MLKKYTVKQYMRVSGLSDAGIRKQVNNQALDSVVMNGVLYILVESNEVEELKQKIKGLRATIKLLKREAKLYLKQDEALQSLRDEVKSLREELSKQISSKEELYEKAIGQQDRILGRYEKLLTK